MKKIKLEKSHYLFTSEATSQSHGDKLADQISDSIIDNFIAYDKQSHCAVEVSVTTGQVIVSGEVKSKAYVPIEDVVRQTINRLGYTKSEYQFSGDSCGVLTAIHEQSPDIDMGVTKENPEDMGCGDNGIYFGYATATDELDNYMPATIDIAHRIMIELTKEREDYERVQKGAEPENGRHYIPYYRPDGKCMVTGEYDENNRLVRITDIVVCQQHDEFDTDDARMQNKIREDFIEYIMPRVIAHYSKKIQSKFGDYKNNIRYLVNPTGKFFYGGPAFDSSCCGRKLVCDLYGGWAPISGGSISAKCYTKSDRSMNYFTRYVAKNLVAAGIAERCLVQSSSAIGVAEPISIMLNTYGTAKHGFNDTEISEKIAEIFDWRPYGVIKTLKLDNPIYAEAASNGQVGHEPRVAIKHFHNQYEGDKDIEVELFTWEKLDAVDKIKKAFNID